MQTTTVALRAMLSRRGLRGAVETAAPAAAVMIMTTRGMFKHCGQPSSTSTKTKQQPSPRSQSPPSEIRSNSTLVLPNTRPILNNNNSKTSTSLENRFDKDNLSNLLNPKIRSSDPYNNNHLPVLPVDKFRNSAGSALSMYAYQRKIKSTKLSKYLQLLQPETEEGTYSQVHRKTNKEHRPLVLVYPWLMAQDKHVNKYTRLYTDLGIDVLLVTISPLDLLNPVPRAQVAAHEVLEYLLDNPAFNKLFLHGMSVGAYAFMEVMTKMEKHEDRYLCIKPRFTGQIWDSPCDLPGLKEGVSRSMTDNRKLQLYIMGVLDWFLEIRYEAATQHYVKTQDMFHKNYNGSPALFLYSRADPVSVPYINSDLANNWHDQGYEVFSNVFNESKHVGHYSKYKAEYKAHVYAFLYKIGMLKYAGILLED